MVGGRDRLGLWTVPLFVAVGLLGAVLAGSLAAVYYAQKVRALENETADARRELQEAAAEVRDVARQATDDIRAEVDAVRDELAVSLPVEDPAEVGIAAVRAEVSVPSQPAIRAGPGQTERPETETRREVRNGSAFAAVQTADETFFVTAFAVVAHPEQEGQAIDRAEVLFAGRRHPAEVHSWSPERDLALLRVPGVGDAPPVAEWRPDDEEVPANTKLFAAGLTPTGGLVQIPVTVGGGDADVIVIDAGLPEILRGGPLLDARGRVVGVSSTAYAPYGGAGTLAPAVPVGALCERLIRC